MYKFDVTKLKAGDEDALRSFYNFIVPRIRRIVSLTLHNRIEVEDVVEEIITRILSNFDVILNLEEPKKMELYCLRIAKNFAVESRRRFEKEDRSVELTESYLNQKTASVVTDPEETAIRVETIRKSLSKLTSFERELVTLHYVEGLTTHKIAELLGISTNRTRMMLNRIASKLKRNMTQSKSKINHLE